MTVNVRDGVIIETDRLLLRRFRQDDAEFVLELLNERAFHEFIGDRGVRTVAAAREYVRTGPEASYAAHGYGPWLVALRDGGTPIGLCGLLRRAFLDGADLGFAVLAEHRARGYAFESASAVLVHARDILGLGRIVAITTADNHASIRLLERLGFEYERPIDADDPGRPLRLYANEA